MIFRLCSISALIFIVTCYYEGDDNIASQLDISRNIGENIISSNHVEIRSKRATDKKSNKMAKKNKEDKSKKVFIIKNNKCISSSGKKIPKGSFPNQKACSDALKKQKYVIKSGKCVLSSTVKGKKGKIFPSFNECKKKLPKPKPKPKPTTAKPKPAPQRYFIDKDKTCKKKTNYDKARVTYPDEKKCKEALKKILNKVPKKKGWFVETREQTEERSGDGYCTEKTAKHKGDPWQEFDSVEQCNEPAFYVLNGHICRKREPTDTMERFFFKTRGHCKQDGSLYRKKYGSKNG